MPQFAVRCYFLRLSQVVDTTFSFRCLGSLSLPLELFETLIWAKCGGEHSPDSGWLVKSVIYAQLICFRALASLISRWLQISNPVRNYQLEREVSCRKAQHLKSTRPIQVVKQQGRLSSEVTTRNSDVNSIDSVGEHFTVFLKAPYFAHADGLFAKYVPVRHTPHRRHVCKHTGG